MGHTIEQYFEWIVNEYDIWKQICLNCSSEELFLDFRNDPFINRMLEINNSHSDLFLTQINEKNLPWEDLIKLDSVGNLLSDNEKLSCTFLRYIYYAQKILKLIDNAAEISIIEIGGGFGGLCAVIHLLAKKQNIKIKEYAIYDLQETQKLQKLYLSKTIDENENITFLDSNNLDIFSGQYSYCLGFYSVGEFVPLLKKEYIDKVISKVPHGFIIWNPYQKDEAGENLLKNYHPNINITPENPSTGPNNLEMVF